MKNDRIITRPAAYIGRMSGIVTVPSDHDPAKEQLPVIVFLHGAGEVGDGYELSVQRVRVHGIPKLFGADADYGGLRVITVSPQCPEGFIWDQVTFQTKEFIDAVVEQFNGDRSHIALTGLSMGGFGTWNLLTTYPDAFRCAAPICGGGVVWRIGERLRGKPIRIYHSVDDDSVPYLYAAMMAQRAQQVGAAVELISYCGEGHGCWNRAYEQTDLIEWLATV